MDFFEVMGVGMFLDQDNPHPRHAVHLVWAGEKVRPNYKFPSPTIDQTQRFPDSPPAVSLPGLVLMKLLANRDQDRVHLRDMIDVGLIDRDLQVQLPAALAKQLDALLTEAGR